MLLRILGYVSATILGNATNLAIADRPAMLTAKQLVMAFQARSGGGGFNIAAIGGVNLTANTQYVTPAGAADVFVPDVLDDLSALVREQMGAAGDAAADGPLDVALDVTVGAGGSWHDAGH